MSTFSNTLQTVLVAGAFIIGLSACDNDHSAEQAGRKLDQAAEQAGKQLNDAAETLGAQIEKAGQHMQEAAKDAKEQLRSEEHH